MRKTKIISTLGPASSRKEIIKSMLLEGADVFRLNFAHGTLEEKAELIKIIRELENDLSIFVGIIADVPGRGPRIGKIKKQYLNRGERVVLSFGVKESDNPHIIPVPSYEIYNIVETGDEILLADGRIIVKVDKILENEAEGVIISDGEIRSNVSITIRNKPLPFPALSERDKKIVRFAIDHEVDYVAMSFVQSPGDVRELRNYLNEYGGNDIKIIAKIENKPAIINLRGIIQESDAIMVARGDLGVQLSLEEIPYLEGLIISETLREGKPVILATQVLESMIDSPVPTRAEIMDIATAIEKGVDAIMVSGETAIGKYPTKVISWLRRIIENVENYTNFPRYEARKDSPIYIKFNRSIVSIAEFLDAIIIAFSTHGFTAMAISRFRPREKIYVVSNSKRTVRQLKLLWGVYPIYVKEDKVDLDALKKIALENKLAGPGERLVTTLGWREELGTTQEIRVEEIA